MNYFCVRWHDGYSIMLLEQLYLLNLFIQQYRFKSGGAAGTNRTMNKYNKSIVYNKIGCLSEQPMFTHMHSVYGERAIDFTIS